MPLPDPEPGLVFRYDYLWSRESRQGRTTSKERPACIAVATDSETDPSVVLILPITHSKPAGRDVGIEIPARVRRNLGLDDEPCWVIVTDANVDDWPNPGIAPVPGKPKVFAYGILPNDLFQVVKAKAMQHYDRKRITRR